MIQGLTRKNRFTLFVGMCSFTVKKKLLLQLKKNLTFSLFLAKNS